MKRLILGGIAIFVVLATSALAATGMVLTQDDFYNGLPGNPAPTWCYHEDSAHIRVWRGTLGPGESFSVPLRFCTNEEWSGGAGGEGIMFEAGFWDGHQSVSLKLILPDGTIRQAHLTSPGWLWGCYVPYVQVNGVIRGPIPSGTYQVVLTNTGSKAIQTQKALVEQVWVDMADLAFQQQLCPLQDQNIGPIL